MSEPLILLVVRVADATSMVKGSNADHACSNCREPVLVSPASQEALGWGYISAVLCLQCAEEVVRKTDVSETYDRPTTEGDSSERNRTPGRG